MSKTNWLFVLFLVVILFGIYWKTFDYDLIWDDALYFQQNILFIEHHPLSSAFRFGYFGEQLGVQGQDHYYRPLLTASFLLENKLWGIQNVTLRLTNLLIYLCGLFLLFAFLKQQGHYPYFAEIVTLLFALYPLNMENIVWIVGRSDLLVLLWGALCLLFLDLFARKGRALFLLASAASYCLGILSKETFILFFPLLVLYEAQKRRKVSILYHLTNLGTTLTFFFIKAYVLDIKNVQFIFSKNIGEDIKIALGTLGYYFRTLLFPIKYDMFVPKQEVKGISYQCLGVVAILFLAFVLVKSVKDSRWLFPTATFAVFLVAHIVLMFTSIFPYQASSRYMMISGLGLVWMLGIALKGIPERARFVATFVIIFLFIPAVVVNGGSFKSKTQFWERARRSWPQDAYVLFQSAKTSFEDKDYLSAELYLNRSLSSDMKRETAILVSSIYADIEIARADYKSADRWLQSIEELEDDPKIKIAPFIRYQVNEKKAKIQTSRGDIEAAEASLLDNLAHYSTVKESYQQLYDTYCAYGLWDKAAALEKVMKSIFPAYFGRIDTAAARAEFAGLPFEKKMAFYIKFRNFEAARSLLQTLPKLDLDHQLLLARLYYYGGLPEEGEKIIAGVAQTHPGDIEVLNKIGYLYLSNLLRVTPALAYFDKSLQLKPNQPELISLSGRLKTNYLRQLKPVWQ